MEAHYNGYKQHLSGSKNTINRAIADLTGLACQATNTPHPYQTGLYACLKIALVVNVHFKVDFLI